MHEDAGTGMLPRTGSTKKGIVRRARSGYEIVLPGLRKLIGGRKRWPIPANYLMDASAAVSLTIGVMSLPRKGDVVESAGSTRRRFAYHIHSDGHRCIGAKISGRIVPFTYQLQNGRPD